MPSQLEIITLIAHSSRDDCSYFVESSITPLLKGTSTAPKLLFQSSILLEIMSWPSRPVSGLEAKVVQIRSSALAQR